MLLAIGAALVAILVTGLTSVDNRWHNYLQLPIWAWLTVSFGWLMPKSVVLDDAVKTALAADQ